MIRANNLHRPTSVHKDMQEWVKNITLQITILQKEMEQVKRILNEYS
jgi:hypothetical protein